MRKRGWWWGERMYIWCEVELAMTGGSDKREVAV